MSRRFLAVACVSVFSVLAASGAEAQSVCAPGIQVACACPGLASGAQVCAADGSRYEPCVCAPLPAPAATAIETSPNWWLVGSGIAALSLGYVVTIAVGGVGANGNEDGFAIGAIPLAGAFILAALDEYDLEKVMPAFIATGLAQVGGLTALIVGLALREEEAPPTAPAFQVGFTGQGIELFGSF
jgi:hypothetical protein